MLRIPFLVGLCVGLGMSAAVPAMADPGGMVETSETVTVPVHELAAQSWPYMSQQQRQLVDVMARDHYRYGTTDSQKKRISGSTDGQYESLPEWRKAPFRGIALRQLGHRTPEFRRDAV
ncbi:MAG: hypothetical protein AAF986_00050 [Pseudomonadota bacterium]